MKLINATGHLYKLLAMKDTENSCSARSMSSETNAMGRQGSSLLVGVSTSAFTYISNDDPQGFSKTLQLIETKPEEEPFHQSRDSHFL